ncbi:Flp pilus assembly protein CpaB [Aestuariibius sp. 2305UL40-4]|uniref:Flp pilus assembly protein CpaB n=1 Tax=Aestuariibius violaceus TaxID=3234132 RepID=UPI00345ED652
MRAVFLLVLLLGLGLAGGAVYLAQDYMAAQDAARQQLEAERAQMVRTVTVMAAANSLVYGQEIRREDLKEIQYPEASLPEGIFKTLEEVFPQGESVLRYAIRPIEPNEPLMSIKTTEPGEIAGISQLLSPGMNAFAVAVDAQRGVSGLLRPGDRVNVYWTGSVRGRGTDFTQLIESNVRIIAIDQTSDQNFAGTRVARTVTVEATPQQVAALTQAQNTGRISLSLVSQDEQQTAQGIEIDTNSLLGIREETPVQAPEARRCYINQRGGGQITQIEIPCRD